MRFRVTLNDGNLANARTYTGIADASELVTK